jgi:hypothetical protein
MIKRGSQELSASRFLVPNARIGVAMLIAPKTNIRAFLAKLPAAHLPYANLASKTYHSCIRGFLVGSY